MTNVLCWWGIPESSSSASGFQKFCYNASAPAAARITAVDPIPNVDTPPSPAESSDIDNMWVLAAGFLVFFMQCGFMCLEAGAIKERNVQNILFKNIMDACINAITWYIFGFTVAYGVDSNGSSGPFIGSGSLFPALDTQDYVGWFFQWTFAATAATIVSGSVAERCKIEAYFVYTMFISIWVYPVVVHWVWTGDGFLAQWGIIDFAGSAVVHMVGGVSGLAGAFFLGPRKGRFEHAAIVPADSNTRDSESRQAENPTGHSIPLQMIGCLILWFGWFGFNGGSTLGAAGATGLAAKVCANTTVAAAMGGLSSELIVYYFERDWLVGAVINGILAGLVSITAGCAVVDLEACIGIGAIGGLIYYGSSQLLIYLKIDDPLDAFPVHGVCGLWGIWATGIFGTQDNIVAAGYDAAAALSQGERVGRQLAAGLLIGAWALVHCTLLFGGLAAMGQLRVSEEEEAAGLDAIHHRYSAYQQNIENASGGEIEIPKTVDED